ncbi:MAG: SpoIIE family protein phosphatase [Bryobacterales bacterium]|nr:SpoIIE family protein phosphatase [Bryobacterales bacterium]
MARLLITAPDGSMRSLPLDQAMILGRGADVQLPFPEDNGLSRQHLEIAPAGSRWTVRDLGSKNGTSVNGAPVRAPHVLRHNDQITASRVLAIFEDAASSTHQVTFDAHEAPPGPERTILTSLEKVLSKEGLAAGGAEARVAWDTPARVLLRAGRELAERRPLEELFQVLLNLAMEAVDADRGVLLALEDGQLLARASSGGEFRLSAAVRDRVIVDRASLLVRDVGEDRQLQNRQSIVLHKVHSLIATPLQADGRVTGLLYVDCWRASRSFTEEDLELLTVLANTAAIRIEHERLAAVEAAELRLRAELTQAAEIQRLHLPAGAPEAPGLDVSGRNVPCRTVGGDYFDYFRHPDGRLGVIIADVAGKGLPAALLMMGLQARVQALAESHASLATLVGRLNRSLVASCPANRFITLFALAIDPSSGEFTYVNAGHNPPLLRRAGGGEEELAEGGVVLGLLPVAVYKESRGTLHSGDCLLLYTDGIVEAESPREEEYDLPRLRDLVCRLAREPAAAIVEAIEREVEVWTAGAPPADDRTLVVLRKS